MACSVGVCCREDCRRDTYGKTICEYHYKKHLYKYCYIFGQHSCEPIQLQKKVITKGLKEISLKVARLYSRPDFLKYQKTLAQSLVSPIKIKTLSHEKRPPALEKK
ncbi:hypothetical protein PR048_004848, partial [Dryococelus australis]